MNLTVFTSVIGNTDTLKDPAIVNPAVRYVCFTDRPIRSHAWEPIPVEAEACPIHQSRRIKIRAVEYLPLTDVSLWVDAAYQLTMDPMLLVRRGIDGVDVLALRHPDRSSILDEAEEIVRLGKAPEQAVGAQLAKYAAFIPLQRALTTTGLLVRRHSRAVRQFCRRWWREFEEAGHTRDQMSVDFSLWQSDIDVAYLEGSYRRNPYARWFDESSPPLATSRTYRSRPRSEIPRWRRAPLALEPSGNV